MTRLPRVTGKDALKALQQDGFEKFGAPGKDVLVTAPVHAGRTIAPKTLASILKQAQLTAERFAGLL